MNDTQNMSDETNKGPARPIEKVSIIISKGSLEGIYPGLIMANGALLEGIEAMLFFTFFGLDAITSKRMDAVKLSTVGNPGLHIPAILGALPGAAAIATQRMQKEMDRLDIPPIGEFIEMIHDSGGEIWACKAAMDIFKRTREDLCKDVDGILNIGDFYAKSAGANIIFT